MSCKDAFKSMEGVYNLRDLDKYLEFGELRYSFLRIVYQLAETLVVFLNNMKRSSTIDEDSFWEQNILV